MSKNPVNKNGGHNLYLTDSNFVSEKTALDFARHLNRQIFLNHSNDRASKPTGGNNGYSIGGDSNEVHLLSTITHYFTVNDDNGEPALYVINYAADSGFIIISANYRFEPICAYSDHGNINPTDTIPAMLGSWFGHTVEDIEMIRSNEVINDSAAAEEWAYWANVADIYVEQDYNLAPPPLNPCLPLVPWTTVGPLLTTEWGQGCGFNEACPLNSCIASCSYGNNAHVAAGCVGVAMAQVIRYWEYPSGYNYSAMPDDYGNYNVQELIFATANSVNTDWGCDESGADAGFFYWLTGNSIVTQKLKQVFGYSSAEHDNHFT